MNAFAEFVKLLFSFKVKDLFVTPTTNGFTQFFRFIFTGMIATLVDLAVATLLFEAGGLQAARWHLLGFDMGALVANGAGFLVGMTTNYLLTVVFVFRYQHLNRTKEFLSFSLIGIIGLMIKLVVVALLSRYALDLSDTLFGILPMVTVVSIMGTLVAFLWNFFARKYGLYSKKSRERLGQ